MAELRWTLEAERWLRDIHDYIAQDNPDAAAAVVSSIYQRSQTLLLFPQIGHRYRVEPDGEVRVLLYGHYRIAYLLKRDGVIEVLGVFHAALNIDQYLP